MMIPSKVKCIQLLLTILLFQGCFVLVVKTDKTNNGSYKIRRMSNSNEYTISGKSDENFGSLAKLISFYKTNNSLKILLQIPVSRIREAQRERDKWEIGKDSIEKTLLLGSGNFGEVAMSVCHS